MYLTDFHMHSNCSEDARDTMLDMARAAKEHGICQLCFTDHCDLDAFTSGEPDPDCFSRLRPKLERAWAELQQNHPKGIQTGLGLELGEANHNVELAREIAGWDRLDFVIGSCHNLRGCVDFYCYPYQSAEECTRLRERYLDELIETAALPFIDVIGHIGYIDRYVSRAGYSKVRVNMQSCGDQLEVLLKTVIETGRGIECNVSGLRSPEIRGTLPGRDILARYRELGGEIITLGADSHNTRDAGVGIADGYALLHELGYHYITVFHQRKPEFIRI